MATIINSPTDRGEGVGTGLIVGLLVIIVAGLLFYVYGLPALRDTPPTTQKIEIQLPTPTPAQTP